MEIQKENVLCLSVASALPTSTQVSPPFLA